MVGNCDKPTNGNTICVMNRLMDMSTWSCVPCERFLEASSERIDDN